MPFNPRRPRKSEEPPSVVLTASQITAAIDIAVELRRRAAINANEVQGQPLHPADAVRSTEGYRLHSESYKMKRRGITAPDPWWRVGWVSQQPEGSWMTPPSQTAFLRTWEVWLNVDDGRVWLRSKRHG